MKRAAALEREWPPAFFEELCHSESLTYNSGPNPAQLDEPLEIRLIAVDYTDGDGFDGYEVDFDEVSLQTFIPPTVPTVTGWGMIILSLLLLDRGANPR